MWRGRIVIMMSVIGAAGMAPRCRASDYSFFFTVSNDVSPEQASTTVTLWAAFPEHWYAFGMSNTEVWGAPDSGGFSDPTILMYQDDYGDPGEVSPDGDTILGIRFVQLQYIGGQFADTSNPLLLWSATWATDDFTSRQVPIATMTSDFWVYTSPGGHGENFYGPDFSEAEGVIKVVPAPAGVAVIGVGGVLGARRRR